MERLAAEEDDDDDRLPLFIAGGVLAAGGGAVLALSGGSGGSSGGSSKKKAPPADREYEANHALGLINARDAYDRGFAGQDVLIAVIDDGFALNHREFEKKLVHAYNAAEDSDELHSLNHGTHVLGIAAARKNGKGMHGVAHQAATIPIGLGDRNERMQLGAGGQNLGRALRHAVDQGADVVNNSYVISGLHAGSMTASEGIGKDQHVPACGAHGERPGAADESSPQSPAERA